MGEDGCERKEKDKVPQGQRSVTSMKILTHEGPYSERASLMEAFLNNNSNRWSMRFLVKGSKSDELRENKRRRTTEGQGTSTKQSKTVTGACSRGNFESTNITFEIPRVSEIGADWIPTKKFSFGDTKWNLRVYDGSGIYRGDVEPNCVYGVHGYLCGVLSVVNVGRGLPRDWKKSVTINCTLKHWTNPEKNIPSKPRTKIFDSSNLETGHGFCKQKILDPDNGYVRNDTLIVDVNITMNANFFSYNSGPTDDCGLEELEEQTELYMDAGFMAMHSVFVRNFIEDMNLGFREDSDSVITIPIPYEFCPGRCTFRDVHYCIAHLYYPQEFPLKECRTTLLKLVYLAEYFEMPMLMKECMQCLYDYICKDVIHFDSRKTVRGLDLPRGSQRLHEMMDLMLLCERCKHDDGWSILIKSLMNTKRNSLRNIINHNRFSELLAEKIYDVLQIVVDSGC